MSPGRRSCSLAAQRRHDAERAGVVAADRDRHPGRVRRLAAGGQGRREDLERLEDLDLRLLLDPRALEQRRQRAHVVGAEDDVDPRRPAGDLAAVLLREAPADGDLHARAGGLDRGQVAEVAVEPVVGVLAHRAGVEDDDVGRLAVRGARRSRRPRATPREPLGVVHVHLAAEGAHLVGRGRPPVHPGGRLGAGARVHVGVQGTGARLMYAPPVRPRLPHVLAAAVVLDATGRHVLLAREQDRPRWRPRGRSRRGRRAAGRGGAQAGASSRPASPGSGCTSRTWPCSRTSSSVARAARARSGTSSTCSWWWSMQRSRCTTGRTTGTAGPRGSASATCRATSPLGVALHLGGSSADVRRGLSRRSSPVDLGVRLSRPTVSRPPGCRRPSRRRCSHRAASAARTTRSATPGGYPLRASIPARRRARTAGSSPRVEASFRSTRRRAATSSDSLSTVSRAAARSAGSTPFGVELVVRARAGSVRDRGAGTRPRRGRTPRRRRDPPR